MLVRALDDREEQVQCAAAAGLGLLGDKRGIDIVLKFTHPKNPLKWEALRSLNLITRKRFPVTLEGLSRAVNYVKKHKKKLTKS